MIDWLTLRTPINHFIDSYLADEFMQFIGEIHHYNSEGVKTRTKYVMDIDKLRSDEKGIFWQIQSDGKGMFLTVGASPASLEYNSNVFGTDDIRHCASILIRRAEQALSMILPPPSAWQCRRLDVTENYLLDDNSQVKQALRELRKGDGSRQKATNNGGDTVYWGAGSDYVTLKAYDKGSQTEYLENKSKRKGKPSIFNDYTLSLLKRLLRLELSLKRVWCDRHLQDYLSITPQQLRELHAKYFGQFIGKIEVTDMGTLLDNLKQHAPSEGQALAAHRTWALIKTIGYEQTKASMPERTFTRHKRLLLDAGLSMADLQSATILEFRKRSIVLSEPVRTWDDLLRAA